MKTLLYSAKSDRNFRTVVIVIALLITWFFLPSKGHAQARILPTAPAFNICASGQVKVFTAVSYGTTVQYSNGSKNVNTGDGSYYFLVNKQGVTGIWFQGAHSPEAKFLKYSLNDVTSDPVSELLKEGIAFKNKIGDMDSYVGALYETKPTNHPTFYAKN